MEKLKILQCLADYLDKHYVNPKNPQVIFLTKEEYDKLELDLVNKGHSTAIKYNSVYEHNNNRFVNVLVTYCGYTFSIIITDHNSLLWEVLSANNHVAHTSIQPLGDKLVITPIEEDSSLASGLLMPETSKEKPMKGRVEAIGINDVASKIKVGDIILYSKHSGVEVTLEGKEYLIMRESDIFAII